MAKDKLFYLIYRVYHDDEHDAPYLFGWTENKHVAKAFLGQRDPKKYIMYKVSEDELISEFSESIPGSDLKIDYVKLKSSTTKETILFFTTLSELQETEKKIQAYFRELSSLDKICRIKGSKDLMYYFTMFMNLKPRYAKALYDIGYRPQEYDALFNAFDENEMNDSIEYAYSEGRYLTEWDNSHRNLLPAQTIIEDISKIVIYSLESFIKVLHEDL
jgi:hypothetical protein